MTQEDISPNPDENNSKARKTRFVSQKLAWQRALLGDPNLRQASKILGCLLTHFLNSQLGIAYASNATYAEQTGMDERTIQRALRDLTQRGWVTVRRGGNGPKSTNMITANFCENYAHMGVTADTLTVGEKGDAGDALEDATPNSPPISPRDQRLRVTNQADKGDKSGQIRVTPVTPESLSESVSEAVSARERKEGVDREQDVRRFYEAFGPRPPAQSYQRSIEECARVMLLDNFNPSDLPAEISETDREAMEPVSYEVEDGSYSRMTSKRLKLVALRLIQERRQSA